MIQNILTSSFIMFVIFILYLFSITGTFQLRSSSRIVSESIGSITIHIDRSGPAQDKKTVCKFLCQETIVTQHELMRLFEGDIKTEILSSTYCSIYKKHFDTKMIFISYSYQKL